LPRPLIKSVAAAVDQDQENICLTQTAPGPSGSMNRNLELIQLELELESFIQSPPSSERQHLFCRSGRLLADSLKNTVRTLFRFYTAGMTV
jgi:hypothetical protein